MARRYTVVCAGHLSKRNRQQNLILFILHTELVSAEAPPTKPYIFHPSGVVSVRRNGTLLSGAGKGISRRSVSEVGVNGQDPLL